MQVAGFSGTNDKEPVLPLTVKAMASEDARIQATNGHMLCTLARPGKCTVKQLLNNKCKTQCCETLLDLVLKEGARALIDAGAPASPVLLLHTSLALKCKLAYALYSMKVVMDERAHWPGTHNTKRPLSWLIT